MNPRFAALLCAALLLRIVVAAFPGYTLDREVFASWAQVLATQGPLAIYGRQVVPPVDYSPGYLYVLWAIGLAHRALGGGAISLRILLEIVPIVGDLALVSLLYVFARRITTESRALAFAAIVAFAPPLWIDSAAWGQADAVPIVLAMLAIFAALDRRGAVGWPLLCASIVIKPLSVAIAPVMAVLQAREKPMWRGLIVATLASFAIAYLATLPFTTQRAPIGVLHFLFDRYAGGASKAPFISEGAFTFFPIFARFGTPDATHVGPLAFRIWGIALVVIGIGAAAVTLAVSLARGGVACSRELRVLGAASLSLLALFLFATRMHERYLLPGIAFGAPLGLEDRPTALALGWLALSFSVNCAFIIGGFSGNGHHPATLAIARACSVGNVTAFALLWQRQLRRLA